MNIQYFSLYTNSLTVEEESWKAFSPLRRIKTCKQMSMKNHWADSQWSYAIKSNYMVSKTIPDREKDNPQTKEQGSISLKQYTCLPNRSGVQKQPWVCMNVSYSLALTIYLQNNCFL